MWKNSLRVSYPGALLYHFFRDGSVEFCFPYIQSTFFYLISYNYTVNSTNIIKHLLCIRVCTSGMEYAEVNGRDMVPALLENLNLSPKLQEPSRGSLFLSGHNYISGTLLVVNIC